MMYLAAYELTQVPLPYIIAYYIGLPLHCCLLHTDSACCIHFVCSLLLMNVKHVVYHCMCILDGSYFVEYIAYPPLHGAVNYSYSNLSIDCIVP